MKLFIESIIFSYSQIFFSNRKWFGIVILAASFITPISGIFAFVGVIISSALALYLKFNKEKIRNGFYGFNGILFGAAIGYFFEITPFVVFLLVVFIIITFFISAGLEHLLHNLFNLPGLSLPFILTLYIFLIFATNYNDIFYASFLGESDFLKEYLHEILNSYFGAMSLILFQKTVLSGIIITAAILFFSRVMFLNTIIGFAVNYLFLHIFYQDVQSNVLILTSFNSILAAIALGGSLIIVSRKSFFLIAISILMVIVFTGFFSKLLVSHFLPVLVLSFNLIVLSIIYTLKFRQEQSDLVLLYFAPGSPEENIYYHSVRKARFERFKYLYPELPVNGEWKISQGIDGELTHKDEWKYAWDFIIIGESGNEFENEGNSVEDYYCFASPVIAPLSGEVVRVIDKIEDNKVGEINVQNNWGNTIIVDHGQGLYSSLSHLKKNSIKVKKGDQVKKGDLIAQCGNSGRSPYPHLHFQFQLTNKLGDKTYMFPFSFFVERENTDNTFKSFDYPIKDKFVKNIETDSSLSEAFNFQLGSNYIFDCSINGKNFTEKWEVKADILNNIFIQSDNNSKAFLYPNEKAFYMSSYIGQKNSALYYFYMSSSSVPLGLSAKLTWNDPFPVSLTANSFVKYISEFLLHFGEQIKSNASYNFEKDNDKKELSIASSLEVKGQGIFKLYRENSEGNVIVDKSGNIKEFTYKSRNHKFIATNKRVNYE
ncbi:MAG: urea transporter [Bacteroidetes bacterium]|nr:urea transporter [Bacteroidota bacterium]